MRILILHRTCSEKRKTIDDHLYSFLRYVPDVEFLYWDVCIKIPSFLSWIKWDGIILHYTLLAQRFDPIYWEAIEPNLKKLNRFYGHKVAIPQDEYVCSNEMCDLIRDANIDTVFTCAMPIDYETLYPLDKTRLKYRITTLTGFVDEETLKFVNDNQKNPSQRSIDIGYRARNVPYFLGRHGLIKNSVCEAIKNTPNKHRLKVDVSTDPKEVFLGSDWIRFILNCRTMAGCLGGSSLHDPDGSIMRHENDYRVKNPQTTFEEVESKLFPGKDFSLNLFALSPRHFECTMTKTCQLLVEGDYQGVFLPGIHYIEIKKDFSNLEEVFDKVMDREYCKRIADNAYRDIVESGKYTYSTFANGVISHIREQLKEVSFTPKWKKFIVKNVVLLNNLYWFIDYCSYRICRKLKNMWKKYGR